MWTRRNKQRVGLAALAALLLIGIGGVLYGPRLIADRDDTETPPEELPLVEPEDAEPGDPPPKPDRSLPARLDDPWVLVEKRGRRLTVYDGDRPVKRYRVAIGRGRGDKTREGDLCTPEGEFYVTHHNPGSSFHLSMGLSYPSIEDARRGLRDGLIRREQYDAIVAAIRAGKRPPWNTRLGGEIMIHGGGADRSGTAGCIALSNEDVEELYEAIPDGTTVKIAP